MPELSVRRKYDTSVDFDAYRTYRAAHNCPSPVANGLPSPAATAPFFNDPTAPSHNALEPTAGTRSAPSSGAPETAGGVLPAPANPAEPPAPYPTTFAHIVELITSGQPIPGIMEIPNTVLEGQGTQPEKARRKKPWEKDQGTEGTQTAASS